MKLSQLMGKLSFINESLKKLSDFDFSPSDIFYILNETT